MQHLLLLVILLLSTSLSLAESSSNTYSKEKMAACLQTSVASADETMTVKQLQEACKLLLEQTKTPVSDTQAGSSAQPSSDIGSGDNNQPADGKAAAHIEETAIASSNPQAGNKQAPQRRVLQDRLTMEALNRSNRFLLTPHKRSTRNGSPSF